MLAGLPCSWRLVLDEDSVPILFHPRYGRRWIGCIASQPLTTQRLLEQVNQFIADLEPHFPEDDPILSVARWTQLQLERYREEQRTAS